MLCVGLWSATKVFASNSAFQFHWNFGTSGIVYGDQDTKDLHKQLTTDKFGRIIISGDLGVSVKLDNVIRFIAGTNLSLDSFMGSGQSLLHLDYAIFGGIRVYPNLKGFNFGLEYNTGCLTNFYNLPSYEREEVKSTRWGNGFRFVFEYDFSYHTDGFAPVIGINWRGMPRGGYSDNLVGFYFRFAF